MIKLNRWGPVIAWMALIFFLSAQAQLPTAETRWLDFVLEKSAHIFEFAVLAALLMRAMGSLELVHWRAYGVAVLLAWFYALSDEFHQSFVPVRTADWTDILFDWLGAVLGAGLWMYRRMAHRRRAF